MLDELLQLLNRSSVVYDVHVSELVPYGKNAFRLKLRGAVADGMIFQLWLNHSDHRTRYAYQLFRRDQPLLRWDNAPHHPEQVENFPHHFHDELGHLVASVLSGNPPEDLPFVLAEIENYLQRTKGQNS